MDSNQLATIAGVILSLAFSYIPGLNAWYGGLMEFHKKLLMILLLFVAAAGSYGATCLGLAPWLGLELTCNTEGLWTVIMAFFSAVVANQGTYLLAPTPKAVIEAKSKRKQR